jgi:predicted negative regulator of RcsB-dependent stress response
MPWSWMSGCAGGCTWKEVSAVCAFAVLAEIIWLGWVWWMAKHNTELESARP